jgi:hypothetical protein
MLKGSKSLDMSRLPKRLSEKLAKSADHDRDFSDESIASQRIGRLFDDLLDGDRKIPFKTRIGWKWRHFKENYHDFRYRRRNRRVWRKTLDEIRPWEGFHGLLTVMQTHLRDYMKTEEKYGHSAEEERDACIASVKETLALLERMKEPDGYHHRLKEAVDARYPDYKSLITHYKNGGTGSSGDFVAQGDGWVGKEAGLNPREGYFEFADGKFELAQSPDQTETDRLLAQLQQYYADTETAHTQAQIESDADFERLAALLKEHMYSWWD